MRWRLKEIREGLISFNEAVTECCGFGIIKYSKIWKECWKTLVAFSATLTHTLSLKGRG